MKRKAMAAVAAVAGILALAFGCTTPLPTGVGVAPPPIAVSAGPAGSAVSFATQVKPTMTARCVECHSSFNTFAGATGGGVDPMAISCRTAGKFMRELR